MLSLTIALAGATLGGAVSAQAPPPQPLVKQNAAVKLSEHVYEIPDDSVPAVSNIGIIIGSRATLVVDTGLGPRNGQIVLGEVAKLSKNTELYLATTHYHPEHAAGSSAFPPSAKFIVSRIQQKDIEELGQQMVANFAGRTPFHAELLKDVQFRRPDILFDGEYDLDLGGLRVRLLSVGPTHTRGDTAIFVEGDRILFAGDVVMNHAFLAYSDTSSTQAWLAALDRFEPLRPATIVPSHGRVGDASLIGEQRAVLKGLQARVAELKSQGRSADEAVQVLTAEFQASHSDWTAPNRIGVAVRSMYADAR